MQKIFKVICDGLKLKKTIRVIEDERGIGIHPDDFKDYIEQINKNAKDMILKMYKTQKKLAEAKKKAENNLMKYIKNYKKNHTKEQRIAGLECHLNSGVISEEQFDKWSQEIRDEKD